MDQIQMTTLRIHRLLLLIGNLSQVDGQAHLKVGVPWLGIEVDIPLMSHHNPTHYVQSQSRPLTDFFSGEELLKDARLNF